MPASEVMNLYRQHKLHSGPGGPVVKKKKQAVAIQISMARKEGHHIPVKGSFQQGGTAQETGNYLVHEGEEVKKPRVDVGAFDRYHHDPVAGPSGTVKVGGFDNPPSQSKPASPTQRSGDLLSPPVPTSKQHGESGDLPPDDYVSDTKHLTSPANYKLIGDVWHPELKHRSPPDVKGSFQHGGLVPETGNYQVHEGEEVKKQMPMYGRRPVRLEDTGLAASSKRMPFESDPKLNLPPRKSVPAQNVNLKRVPPTGWGTSSGQLVSGPTEEAQRSAQEQDIAARTNQAQHDEWNRAMHQKENYGGPMMHRSGDILGQPPQPRDVPPAGNDPHYAVEGLKGSVAQRMREQGERAAGIKGALGSFDEGGEVKQTGPYVVHEGEELTPPPDVAGMGMPGGTGPGVTAPGMPAELGGTSVTQTGQPEKPKEEAGGRRPNYELMNMDAAVAAPLQRSSSNFDSPAASYKRGGTIPRTGIYRLHEGETVIPKSLAAQYRKARNG